MTLKVWPSPPTTDDSNSSGVKRWFEQLWKYFQNAIFISSDNTVGIGAATTGKGTLEVAGGIASTGASAGVGWIDRTTSSQVWSSYATGGSSRLWNNSLGDVSLVDYTAGTFTFPYAMTVGSSSAATNTLVLSSSGAAGPNIKFIDRNNLTVPRWIRNSAGRIGFMDATYTTELAGFYNTGEFVNTGYIQSNVGVYMPPTGSTNANILDAYQEGTWTPSFSTSGVACVVTYTTQSGNYVRIGKMVYFSFVLGISTVSNTGSGQLFISGLPFTVENSLASEGAWTVTQANNFATTTAPQVGKALPATTTLELSTNATSDGRSGPGVTLAASALLTNCSLYGAGFYFVNT